MTNGPITTSTPKPTPIAGITLLDDQAVFEQMSQQIASEEGLPDVDGRRCVDQAICFTALAGRFPGKALAPSADVDLGWRMFIVNTVVYRAFCQRVAGHFVDRVPLKDAAQTTTSDGRHIYSPFESASLLVDAGYLVDWLVWPRANDPYEPLSHAIGAPTDTTDPR